jgi:hypothetical protein
LRACLSFPIEASEPKQRLDDPTAAGRHVGES